MVEYSDLSAGTNHSFLCTEMSVNLTDLARGTTYRVSVKVNTEGEGEGEGEGRGPGATL